MGRSVHGRGGRVVPGLGSALIDRFTALDRFHRAGDCYWCSQVADVRAGRPVVVDAAALHELVEHDLLGCSGPWVHDSVLSFVVTGDRFEPAAEE